MRSKQWQREILGTISAFAYRQRENKKKLCRGDRSQDLPNTDFEAIICLQIRCSIIQIKERLCFRG